MRFALAQEQRTDNLHLLRRKGPRLRIAGTRNPNVVDELEHPELLEARMGHRTAALVLFESTLAYQALLRLEGPLIENGFFQCLSQLLIKPLFPANGTKLGQIVLVPGCIVFANLLFPLVKPVEIFAQIFAPRSGHVGREGFNLLLHLTLSASFPSSLRLLRNPRR